MKFLKMGYKMTTNIKCLALGEQYCNAKLTGPFFDYAVALSLV